MAWLPHLAYAIGALSFILREIFWLRCVAILSSGLMVVDGLFVHTDRDAQTLWHSIFILIHITNITITLYGEKALRFTDREEELYETLFRNLTRLEFLKLLRAGEWREAPPGTRLTTQGEPVRDLMLISHGAAAVEIDHRKVAELRDGQLIGEMSLVTGGPATATVTAAGDRPLVYLAWPKYQYHALLRRNPTLRHRISGVVSEQITQKLIESTRAAHAH